jgi:V/A-type H+-transporting ATPase subunit E
MNNAVKIEDLEAALMERAHRLAEEYLARARRTRAQIVEEENERLHLREEREVLAAKADAERSYRRHVQAEALRLQEELDRLRWELVQRALKGLYERLDRLADDEERYLGVLRRFLAEGVSSIAEGDLVAEVNARDLARLRGHWDELVEGLAGARHVALWHDPHAGRGGVLVRSVDNTIRVDNTFEGRLQRFEDELHRTLVERLFAQAPHRAALFQA